MRKRRSKAVSISHQAYYKPPARIHGASFLAWANEQGIGLWSKQIQVIESVFEKRKTIVKAGVKVGKTFVAACSAAAFLSIFPHAFVLAPINCDSDLLVTIKRLYPSTLNVSIEDGYQSLSDSEMPTHADQSLLIIDDVPPPANLAMLLSSVQKCLWIATPSEKFGNFYEAYLDTSWSRIHVSVLDSPNFSGESFSHSDKLIDQRWIDAQRWHPNSLIYQSKVHAKFVETPIEDILSIVEV